MIETTMMKMLEVAVKAGDQKRAEDLVALDIHETSIFTDVMLIMDAPSNRQVLAIAQEIMDQMKEAGFEVMDKIHIYAKDNYKILELMKNHKEEIMSEVLAEDMTLGTTDGYVKEWNINKEPVVLGVAKM